MPPRSLCLNVFTSALGNGKEAGVSVKEIEDRMDVDVKEERVEERARHDSVQGPADDPAIASPANPDLAHKTEFETPDNASPIATADIDMSSLNDDIGRFNTKPYSEPNLVPSFCKTCGQPPAEGASLQRCSRCKRAYYCSKACQKSSWKTHKMECEPASNLNTPDISYPASPASTPAATVWDGTATAPSTAEALGEAISENNAPDYVKEHRSCEDLL